MTGGYNYNMRHDFASQAIQYRQMVGGYNYNYLTTGNTVSEDGRWL